MTPSYFFFNDAGRLRSGWRLAIFAIGFIALLLLLGALASSAFFIADQFHISLSWPVRDGIFRVAFLASALLAGALCNYWLEGLPWRALGLSFHAGWWRHFLVGSLVGAGSLSLAVLAAFAAGGLRFEFGGRTMLYPVARSLLGTAVLLLVAALAEEAAFRGYPLQTLTRARLIWFGVLVTSVPFAAVHWHNPEATVFSTVNTALAGVWFVAAYLKTRSLWFPLGMHWAWNWAQGPILGIPVSGLNLSSHPLLQSFDKGPAWLTGGSYGIEGGAACTAVLLISMLVIWRQQLAAAPPELRKFTAEENPVPVRARQTLDLAS